MSILSSQYVPITASVGAYEPNSTYLHNIHYTPMADPLSASTMGLMMLLSTLHYQPISPTYANAVNQASQAAFITTGGQAFQDKVVQFGAKNGESFARTAIHEIGITETQAGFALGVVKVVRDRQISVNGPKIYLINTHLTADPNNVTIGLKYDW